MIVSRLPPSEPNGDIAITIHTPAFKCFVSTAFGGNYWETVVFEGDPGFDPNISARLRLIHPDKCDAHNADLINELVAVGMDMAAETGFSFAQCCEAVAWKLIGRGVIADVDWHLFFK